MAKILPKDNVVNMQQFTASKGSTNVNFSKSANQLTVLLNSMDRAKANAFIDSLTITLPIQELFDFLLIFIDEESMVTYLDSNTDTFRTENLATLTQYQRCKTFLLNYVELIEDLPCYTDGNYVFFKSTIKNNKCLICQVGANEKYYAILNPTVLDTYPTVSDKSYDWEIYRVDLKEFFFCDQGLYDLDECIARIRMAEMLASHKL